MRVEFSSDNLSGDLSGAGDTYPRIVFHVRENFLPTVLQVHQRAFHASYTLSTRVEVVYCVAPRWYMSEILTECTQVPMSHPGYHPVTHTRPVHPPHSVQTHAIRSSTLIYKLYTAYPNTFLGQVFDFLGCPYIFSDKLSGPGINYPGTYPGGPTRLFSSTYKSTPTVIPSVKTVITRVDTLNVMYH